MCWYMDFVSVEGGHEGRMGALLGSRNYCLSNVNDFSFNNFRYLSTDDRGTPLRNGFPTWEEFIHPNVSQGSPK